MKKVLVLGAGQSTPFLIWYLLKEAKAHNWFVTVGDIDLNQARARIGTDSRSSAVHFDVTDAEMRSSQIRKADVVVNMLPPHFQQMVAMDCVYNGTHMISASYEDIRLSDLDRDANRRGVLILNEMGLDPGIDHMSAMAIIDRVRRNGGKIRSFRSYGSGLPAPEVNDNPLRYTITWNPRNIAMMGETGATYLVDGRVKMLPFHEVFQRTWAVEVDGIGTLEACPNRDSLYYRDLFALHDTDTMVRGTLRYPGWCETWLQLVRLGIPNETMRVPSLKNLTYRRFTEMFIPLHVGGSDLEVRVAQFLGLNPTGKIMENLRWLGLFSEDRISANAHTAAEVLTDLICDRFKQEPGTRDMVILLHEIEASYPAENNRRESVRSTMVEYGEGGINAMARTVGLPAGIATKLILTGELPITGCQLPTHPAVHPKVLSELRDAGLEFKETVTPLED